MLFIVETIKKKNFPDSDKWFIFCDKKETEVIESFIEHNARLLNHDKVLTAGRKYSPNGEHKNKKHIFQYDSDGLFLQEWVSLKDVVEHYSVHYSTLSSACSRQIKCGGYYWSMVKLDKYIFKINERGKKCHQYTISGEYLSSFSSVAEAAKLTDINRNSIKDCLNGNQMSAGGFLFSTVLQDSITHYKEITKGAKYKSKW